MIWRRLILDDKLYPVIELPNKLEALLVHDAQTDKASASLNVNVGNISTKMLSLPIDGLLGSS
jgi:secreted Zn-dependent insulinase-like peptidase